MISIHLYQPRSVNAYVQFPEKWDELLPSEVLEIAKHILHPETAKPGIFLALLQSRVKLQQLKMQKNWLTMLSQDDLVNDCLPLVDFLYKSNDLVTVPEPAIQTGLLQKLVGPGNGFETLTCSEFEECEHHFNAFLEEAGPEPLSRLTGVLWRPKGVPHMSQQNGHWSTYTAGDKLINRLKKLEPHRLFAIYLWYAGCRGMLPLMFPTIYSGSEKKTANNEPPDLMAFTKCIHAGAGEKNGSRDDIRRMKLLEFMFDMEQDAIKTKELKALYEQRS